MCKWKLMQMPVEKRKENRLWMEKFACVIKSKQFVGVEKSFNLCNCTQKNLHRWHQFSWKSFSFLHSDLIHQLRGRYLAAYEDFSRQSETLSRKAITSRHPTDPSDINADSKCHWQLWRACGTAYVFRNLHEMRRIESWRWKSHFNADEQFSKSIDKIIKVNQQHTK